MRVIALLSLLFGFMGEMLLDGQTFTHAVFGIIFGAAAITCGLSSAHRDRANATCLWEGRIMAALGLALAVFCVIQLPSAYRFQTKFNDRSKSYQRLHETAPTPNHQGIEKTRAQRSVIPIRG
jgi:predicted phage tail protein